MGTSITRTCALFAALGIGLASVSTEAAELRLRCETRSDPLRSKISVDARDLYAQNAVYTAQVVSGGVTIAHPPVTAVGDEAEFDFDSRPRDVAAGARAIPADFIQGNRVTASVMDAAGTIAAGPRSVSCRAR